MALLFETTVLAVDGKDLTGIFVPQVVMTTLGAGNRPTVTVSVNGSPYRSVISMFRNAYIVPISADYRERAHLTIGDDIVVTLELVRESTAQEIRPHLANQRF